MYRMWALCALVFVVWTATLCFGAVPHPGLVAFLTYPPLIFTFFFSWFNTVEPVRGSKVSHAITAFCTAHVAHRKSEVARMRGEGLL
jgi:hypothetical protein